MNSTPCQQLECYFREFGHVHGQRKPARPSDGKQTKLVGPGQVLLELPTLVHSPLHILKLLNDAFWHVSLR